MLTLNQLLQQGRYRIINSLGQNGIGVGYEAFDNVLGTNVLLKEIAENLNKVTTAAQLEARKRAFAEDAKFLTELKHESVLQVCDYFSEIDRHYLVMEYSDGNNLSELAEKKQSAVSLAELTGWAEQLLDALHYLHTQKPPIFHGRVTPQNVKLTSAGKIKLLALEIISKNRDAKAETAASKQAFDAATLPYSPLEQIWEGLDSASQKVILNSFDEQSEKILEMPVDARSDLYALAATLYYLATARIPIDALTRSIDILEGKPDPLPAPNQLNGDIPPEISDVLMKALEIKREERFSSAAIMRQVLRTAGVRARERAAREALGEDEAVLEIPFVEPKPPVTEQKLAEQKNLTIEAEQKRQIELIKEQLREAEAQRLKAEQRAAEAEKRLQETEAIHSSFRDKETQNSADDHAFLMETVNSGEDFAGTAEVEKVFTKPVSQSVASADSSDEFNDLFAQPQKDNQLFKRMSAAAAILVIFGGAVWAVWTFVISKPIQSNQSISSTEASLPAPSAANTPPASNVEATTPKSETVSDPNANPANPSSPDAAQTVDNPGTSPAVKTKPATQTAPQQAKKQAPTKSPENQKKAVTLDDLLKDN